MEWQIENLEALPHYSQKLLENFPDRRVFAFTGEVGAGKTTFIQNICKHLGVTQVVSSPTFALVNEYVYTEASSGLPQSAYHLDLYRLRSIEEALDIGVEDYLYSGNYCLIEWPEMIEPLLPEKIVQVKIEVSEDETRTITADIV